MGNMGNPHIKEAWKWVIAWKSDMILRMAVSTMLTVATLARFLPLAFFSDDAGQSNMCSVSHMQSCADWNSRLNAAVFSNSSTQPFSAKYASSPIIIIIPFLFYYYYFSLIHYYYFSLIHYYYFSLIHYYYLFIIVIYYLFIIIIYH